MLAIDSNCPIIKLEYLAVYGRTSMGSSHNKKFVLPEKVDQSSPNFFRECYPRRPPIMPNFIEIGQTSLD